MNACLDSAASVLREQVGEASIEAVRAHESPQGFRVPAQQIALITQALRDHQTTLFDFLSCLTALDNGEALELIYHLYSLPHHHALSLQVLVPYPEKDKHAAVPSIHQVWKGALWLEREAYDMVGIRFQGHPDLRRLLLPEDWKGYPLRKDYTTQERYHHIRVKY